jgi:endonuclease/exonuclease/phosphatase (EEP) superfamily protein YafD
MYARAADLDSHILLVSEIPARSRNNQRWVTSSDNKCAIVLPRTTHHVFLDDQGVGEGYVWIKSGQFKVFSCYFSPNKTLREFNSQLWNLEEEIRQTDPSTDIIIGGDFNAKSSVWGSARTDKRGQLLSEMMSSFSLITMNFGYTPTYQRANSKSIIDITFERVSQSVQIVDWKVLDTFLASDHKHITFDQQPTTRDADTDAPAQEEFPASTRKWAYRKFDLNALDT